MDKKAENSVVIYTTPTNDVELKVHLEKETVWLTQAQMATLFDRDRDTVAEHIRNIFNEEELQEDPVTRKFPVTPNGKSF